MFDGITRLAPWLSFLGDKAYDIILSVNSKYNWIRHRLGFGYFSLSQYLKARVKKAVDFIFHFEKNLATYCKKRGFDGVICGHIHHAEIKDKGLFGRMQEIDWMYFMGLLRSSANFGLNCTAVGNNMAIDKRAYWDVGGYENLDFSVTEDYKLYKEVRKRGWKTKNILNKNIINESVAIENFKQLMHQRKRWLIGARELPFYWWILFALFGSFAPAIIVVFIFDMKLALIFYLIKLTLQTTSIYILQNKLNVRKNFDYLISYEFYSNFISLATMIFFSLPIKLQWKNRKYSV